MTFFHGKVVIVTGSSDGIGRSAAVLFSRAGASVVLTGRSGEKLAETYAQCLAAGAKEESLLTIAGDITDRVFIERLVTETVERFGRIDVLVNNAGAAILNHTKQSGLEVEIEAFDAVIDINVRSVILLSQLAIPHLKKTKGAIVNVSSIMAAPFVCPQPYYPMPKSCLDQLTVQIAGTLIKKGIRVNSVNPGRIRTNFLQAAGISQDASEKSYDNAHKRGGNSAIPSGECGKPEDIAKIIVFLSDRSQSEIIVGQRIVADGGSLLKNSLLSADV